MMLVGLCASIGSGFLSGVRVHRPCYSVCVNSTPAARPIMMLVRLRASTGRRKSRMEMSASGILFRLPTRLYTVADVVLRNLTGTGHSVPQSQCIGFRV